MCVLMLVCPVEGLIQGVFLVYCFKSSIPGPKLSDKFFVFAMGSKITDNNSRNNLNGIESNTCMAGLEKYIKI